MSILANVSWGNSIEKKIEVKSELMGMQENISALIYQKNPSKEYIAAYNAYINWIKDNIVMEDSCFINNTECCNEKGRRNKAIASHLISKGVNLKPISHCQKVRMLGRNHRIPTANQIKEIALKSATTFPGFCKYHDNVLFELLETRENDSYTEEQVFFLCLRVIAYKRFQAEREYRIDSLLAESFDNDVVKAYLNQSFVHNIRIKEIRLGKRQSRTRTILGYVIMMNRYRRTIRKSKIYSYDEWMGYRKLAKFILNKYEKREYFQFEYCEYSIEKADIAFSSAFYIPYKKDGLFLFLFVLPNGKKSIILVAALKKDYHILIKDKEIKACFNGDLDKIQKLMDLDAESIVFSGKDFDEYEYAKILYETENPIREHFPPNFLKQ